MKYILIFILSLILSACSGGGGGGAEPAGNTNETYNATYSYPAEPILAVGDGTVEHNATGIASCKDLKGNDADLSLCPPVDSAPKKVYESPAGTIDIVVDGADGGVATVTIAKGESFNSLPTEQKSVKVAVVLTCVAGRVKVGAECKIPGYELTYSDYSLPTKTNACDGTENLTRTVTGCRNDITLEAVDASNCADKTDPTPTTVYNSPAGTKAVAVANSTGTAMGECAEGDTNPVVIATTLFCNSGYYRNGSSCDTVGIGYYSSLDTFSRESCPVNSSTVGTISTAITDCLASAGYYKDGNDLFVEVGSGYYSADLDNSRASCTIDASVSSVTWGALTTATSQADCNSNIAAVTACISGKYLANPTDIICSPAQVGYYANGDTTQVQCPANSSTLSSGSTSVNECIANAGYYQLSLGAEPIACGSGLFQNLVGQSLCNACSAPVVSNMVSFSFAAQSALTSDSCGYQVTQCDNWYISSTDGLSCSDSIYMLKDIVVGTGSSSSNRFFSLGNGNVIFEATDGVNGKELWITDGTSGNTQMVKDIRTGSLDSLSFTSFALLQTGQAIFRAIDSLNGAEAWVTDGTAAGTILLKDICPSGPNSNPENFLSLGNGKVVFAANDCGSGGTEAWVTDGTPAGTSLLKDIYSGSTGSYPGFFTLLQTGQAVFRATDSLNGTELWITDGTPGGTQLVKNIAAGSVSSAPQYITSLGNGKVVFAAYGDATYGAELWISDGTSAGTTMVKNIHPSNNSSPQNIAYVGGGKAAFSANDGTHGIEPWITDGTEAGTISLIDANPGVADSYAGSFFSLENGKIVFIASHATVGNELFVTDGTAAGTSLIKDFNTGVNNLYASNFVLIKPGKAVFNGNTPANGNELLVTDGTDAGTVLLRDIYVGASNASIGNKVNLGNGKILFGATNSTSGSELWIMDADAEDGIKGN